MRAPLNGSQELSWDDFLLCHLYLIMDGKILIKSVDLFGLKSCCGGENTFGAKSYKV